MEYVYLPEEPFESEIDWTFDSPQLWLEMKRCDVCRCSSSGSQEDVPLLNSPTVSQEDSCDSSQISCNCGMFPSCMSLLSRKSEPPPPLPGQTAVLLNVYDMYWTNWYTASAGVGVFHSGVQVGSSEWAYGGHPYSFTGVFEIAPRDERELGEQFRFRQSLHIGYTDFSAEEVRRLVSELGKQFRGDRYHLMNNNCNHFTSAFCLALCERDIPAWVNRLAYVSSCVPFLQRCLPKEWLTPAALQQSLAAAHSGSSTRGNSRLREWLTPAALQQSLAAAHSGSSTPQTPQ